MTYPAWLLYGANGYTARLIIKEAIKRGHKPLLAGRSETKIKPIAQETGLDYVVLNLDDHDALKKVFSSVKLVLNAAGPFINTSLPILRACLASRAHYTDITGEIPVFQNTFSFDQEAKSKKIALISGIGFDVIPTDCLAVYVTQQIPDASELELAFTGLNNISPGTMKTMIEMLPNGGLIRKNGQLVKYPLASGAKRVDFPDGTHTVVPIIWGDLETAYRSTRVPNIITYMAYPDALIGLLRISIPALQKLFTSKLIRSVAKRMVELMIKGPDDHAHMHGKSYVWARAINTKGNEKQAWLELPETYLFTAIASIRTIEKIFESRPAGSLTPAMAFGPDFILEINGVKRFDTLPSG
ncbi:MAG: saccharopine dehydrogenase family protein [bacterium]